MLVPLFVFLHFFSSCFTYMRYLAWSYSRAESECLAIQMQQRTWQKHIVAMWSWKIRNFITNIIVEIILTISWNLWKFYLIWWLSTNGTVSFVITTLHFLSRRHDPEEEVKSAVFPSQIWLMDSSLHVVFALTLHSPSSRFRAGDQQGG